MTEPVNRKTKARERTNADGPADGAEAPPTPRQRAVIERYLKRRDSRPDTPRLRVKSKPNKPVEISQSSSADSAGLALAFGTTEAGVASILLNSLINAACEGTPGNPPNEHDIDKVLAELPSVRRNTQTVARVQRFPHRNDARMDCENDRQFCARTAVRRQRRRKLSAPGNRLRW